MFAWNIPSYYSDVTMSAKASQITSISTVCSFVQVHIKENIKTPRHWPFSSHKGPVTQKMFPFDDAVMRIKLSVHSNTVIIEAWTDWPTCCQQIFVDENLYVLVQISLTVTKTDNMPLPRPNTTKFSDAYMLKLASASDPSVWIASFEISYRDKQYA